MLNDKKIPIIPALFHNNNVLSNSEEKSELFNEHFSEQFSLIQSKSSIPLVFTSLTHSFLSSFQFAADDIKSTINKLDPNKMHGHDMISIRMIKLCGGSIYKPLEILFKPRYFSSRIEKISLVPVYKKGDHQCVKNYRQVFLLPVFSKILERLIYNAMLKHLLDNNLKQVLNQG